MNPDIQRIAEKTECPVCKFQGWPRCEETWNGIKGPAAAVIARRWHCPKCGVLFENPDGWKLKPDSK